MIPKYEPASYCTSYVAGVGDQQVLFPSKYLFNPFIVPPGLPARASMARQAARTTGHVSVRPKFAFSRER
jgi:hypothetical protein